jgi:hypothetical protein
MKIRTIELCVIIKRTRLKNMCSGSTVYPHGSTEMKQDDRGNETFLVVGVWGGWRANATTCSL